MGMGMDWVVGGRSVGEWQAIGRRRASMLEARVGSGWGACGMRMAHGCAARVQ